MWRAVRRPRLHSAARARGRRSDTKNPSWTQEGSPRCPLSIPGIPGAEGSARPDKEQRGCHGTRCYSAGIGFGAATGRGSAPWQPTRRVNYHRDVSDAPLAFTLPVAALLLIMAAAGAVTARRGWTGSLRRAGRLGIHSPAATTSDAAFAVANRVAAPVVGGASAIALLLAVLLPALPLPSAGTVVLAVLAFGGIVAMLVAAGVLGEKAARVVPVPARRPSAGGPCGGCGCGGGCSAPTRSGVPTEAVAEAS